MSLLRSEEELMHDFDAIAISKKLAEVYIDIYHDADDPLSISKIENTPEGVIYHGSLMVRYESIKSLEVEGVKLLYIDGDFVCDGCYNLLSLKGSPEKVGGNFNCAYCSRLKTLEGAPKIVGHVFNCEYCVSLTSLEHAPEECMFIDRIGCNKVRNY